MSSAGDQTPQRQKSWVWKFAEDNGDTAKCLICGSVLARKGGSTSSLNKHLTIRHKLNSSSPSLDKENVSSDDVDSTFESIASTSTSSATAPPPQKRRREDSSSRRPPCTASRQEDISRALARMIAKCQLPLSFVHSDGFVEFMEVAEPGYKPVYPQAILARLQLVYTEVRDKIEAVLNKVSDVSLSFDEWSSVAQESYMAVNAHCIDEDWQIRNFNLCTLAVTDRPFAENLAAHLFTTIEEWNISGKISSATHDNAKAVQNATRLLNDIIKYSIDCSAHTLQLASKDAVKSVERYEDVIAKISRVVGHFKHSNVASDALKAKQKALELPEERLVQRVATRFDSSFDMCDTTYRNRAPIEGVLSDRKVTKAAVAVKLEMVEHDWLVSEELIHLLKPLKSATRLFSSESKVTLSIVRPIVKSLLTNHYSIKPTDSEEVRKFKTSVSQGLENRFQMNHVSRSINDVLPQQIASFLDPRYKDLSFETDEAAKIRDCVLQMVLSMPESAVSDKEDSNNQSDGDSDDLNIVFDEPSEKPTGIVQFEAYLREPQISKNDDPLKWWKARANSYPIVAKCAKKYLYMKSLLPVVTKEMSSQAKPDKAIWSRTATP